MSIDWQEPIARMLGRMEDTARQVGHAYPHWANPESGRWTTTSNGDWTGGYWLGMLWLASRGHGGERFRTLAEQGCARLEPRVSADTAFKAATFYYGAALGSLLAGSERARMLGLAAARDLKQRYNPKLGLVPLGTNAEEGSDVGATASSVDSLVVSLLLFWAARTANDREMREVAANHMDKVVGVHQREDGSFIQSSSLDPATGETLRRYTHKGYSANSVWARAQAWGVVCSTISYFSGGGEARWLQAAMKGADWWIAHVPGDCVSYWDFDDPKAPSVERDTAATAFMASAFLKLSSIAPCESKRQQYRCAGERTALALVERYLTPVDKNDKRPPGMLVEGCFNKREDSRAEDYVSNAELIFGSYYLFEALHLLSGRLLPAEI
ncbi:glycoside hydrolase family 88 protein [Bradyrhizobium sp. ARR65]|uniref:glycoside hydrolase family 88 protein n=1 Tax=Bradyrhizobium sp. ARR65 TaxID=1040989 RepID=UPI000A586FEF|nr:glycoside hydrolase family 88 protein [Bradyrhizobium sp. ARR65]